MKNPRGWRRKVGPAQMGHRWEMKHLAAFAPLTSRKRQPRKNLASGDVDAGPLISYFLLRAPLDFLASTRSTY
jgi:hypothetical protein